MRKKSQSTQLTLEPLTIYKLRGFVPIDIQKSDKEFICDFFDKNGMQAHQGSFSRDGDAVLLAGLIEDQNGDFYSWTLFSKKFKSIDYRGVIRCFRFYKKHFNNKRIYHIISKKRPWTRHMAKAFGFKYVNDVNADYEMWDM